MKTSVLAFLALATVAVALLAEPGLRAQELDSNPDARKHGAWEYKVVGMADLHSSTLDYLKSALDRDEGGFLGMAKAADEELAQQTEDVLNEYGAEGWELLEISGVSAIFKRPR